jgi:hypothetical protein
MLACVTGREPDYDGDFPKDRLDASLRWHDGTKA